MDAREKLDISKRLKDQIFSILDKNPTEKPEEDYPTFTDRHFVKDG